MIGLLRPLTHDRRWGPLVSAWYDRETTPAETDAVTRHIARCGRCRARIASYGTIEGEARAMLQRAPVPSVRPIFAAAEAERGRVRWPATRTVAGLCAALLVALAVASPPGRALIGMAANIAQQMSESRTANYAGDHALFRAPAGSVIAYQTRRYSVMSATTDGAHIEPLGAILVDGGGVWSLAGGRVLYDAGRDGQHQWMVAAPDGTAAAPLPNAGNRDVVDVTPDGTRILLRTVGRDGSYATAPSATEVLDASGTILWTGNDAPSANGIDAYALSADGNYIVSGDTGAITFYPLGDAPPLPPLTISGYAVRRPELARNGALAFAAQSLSGSAAGTTTVYVYTREHSLPGIPRGDAFPSGSDPLFALAPDGGLLAVWGVRGGSTLTIWGLTGAAAGKAYQDPHVAGLTVRSLRWSPDGTTLLVTGVDTEGRQIAYLLHPSADLSAARFTPLATDANVAAAGWRPDGGLLLLSDGGTQTGFVAVTANGTTQVLGLAVDAGVRPVFGAGGYLALLQSGRPARLLALHGRDPAPPPGAVTALSWVGDGSGRAAIVIGGQVYLYSPHSGLATQPLMEGVDVRWSPAGDRLLVVHADGGAEIVEADGTSIARAPEGMDGRTLAWAPSGAMLAGVQHSGDGDRLALWSPDARVTVLVTATRIGRLVWSPDGRQIAYSADTGSGARLDVVPARGGTPIDVGPLAALDDDFVWQSDGRALLAIAHQRVGEPGALVALAANGEGSRMLGLASVTHLYAGPR